ncbi:MAG: hypothetical protein EOP47_27355 [Sphingobacteriaceae bacterium]|nr:MAG: hypothetical protein EOP47_27355 [Sphingobacteriaceae bacterium]
MKIINLTLRTAVAVLLIPVLLAGCKKDKKVTPKEEEEEETFTTEILNIVPQATIDSLREWGMVINEGKTPPSLEGSYYTDNSDCFFDNSSFVNLGKWRGNYTYKFYDQDNEKLTIAIDYTIDGGSDVAKGVGSFISGSGDKFSAFFVTEGVSRGIDYKSLTIISGRKTADGIVDWTDLLRITDKSEDPTGLLIDVGGTRIFREDDELATLSSKAGKRNLSIEHLTPGVSR